MHPENNVDVSRAYIATEGGEAPSTKMTLPIVGIQERHPRFNTPIQANAAALNRVRARNLLRARGFLETFAVLLDGLDIVYGHLRRQSFAEAKAAMDRLPLPFALGDITVADVQEAFAVNPETYLEIIRRDDPVGDPDDEIIVRTLAGFGGGELAAQVGHDLVGGGPERDFRLGLLNAEINFGLRNYVDAVHLYDVLLTVAPFESPNHKFVVLRSASARVARGHQLFRKQRILSEQDRDSINRVCEHAVRLLQESGVSPDNPRRLQLESEASQIRARLQSRLNYLGLWDAFVPVQKYSVLQEIAAQQIQAAKTSSADFMTFLAQLEQLREEEMEVQFQKDEEELSQQMLAKRLENATLSVDKIEEQLDAIKDQRESLGAQTDVAVLKALVDAAVTGKQSSGPLGFATGLTGIVGAVANASAQDEQLAHQLHGAEIEQDIAENDVQMAQLEIEISKHRVDFYEQKLAFLTNKRLNINFLSTLVELNERRAERQLEAGIFLAYLFERALAFFLGEPNIRHIQFDYLDRPLGIADAAKALQEDFDLVQREFANVTQEQFDFFEEIISLRESYPVEFSRFLQTGEMDFVYSLYQLSKRRPAAHQCRLREVGVEVVGLLPPTGFSGTLTHHGRFLVRDKAATLLDPAATRLVPTSEQLAQALEEQRRLGLPVAAVGGVLYYDLEPDIKELSRDTQFVSPVRPDRFTLDLFEGHGPTGLWQLEVRDHGQLSISDILLHFAIVSRESDTFSLEPKVEALIRSYEAELSAGDQLDRFSGFSLRQNFPDSFFALQTGSTEVRLETENFPSGLTHLQFKTVIAQALDQQGKGVPGISLEIGRPDVGFSQVRVTRSGGFSEDLDAPPQTLPRDQRFPVIGAWQIRLPNPAQFAQLGDLRLFFMYAFEKL
jgi:receptor-binding and translocation channel-forming TcA subunit of Tc toxin